MTEPEPEAKPKIPRKISRLIWGSAILLTALLLGTALGLALNAWYIQANNDRWCHFYAIVTHQIPGDGTLVIFQELEQAEHESGC